jgi:hypothetical protein
MRVDRKGLHSEGAVQHHIGRLAPHAGQGDQRIPVGRNLAAKAVDQDLAMAITLAALVLNRPMVLM